GNLVIEAEFGMAMQQVSERQLDFAFLVEVLNKGYGFGDRTILSGLHKTPWVAKPDKTGSSWAYFDLPRHAENRQDEAQIATNIYQLLKEELLLYISDFSQIGILLTGGMDSRIIACILHEMIISGELANKNVIAFTWGNISSRDVVYAKRIAALFNWQWEHILVTPEQLFKNYQIVIENGCEYTPIHLHGMPLIAEFGGVDCFIAGSFGDSIGRGEYSGTRVTELRQLEHNIVNIAGLFRDDFRQIVKDDISSDVRMYHLRFPQEKKYQQFELDMQAHYMRRMLNPCMSIINKKKPLF